MKKVILIFSLILMVISCNAGNITGGGNGNNDVESGSPDSKPTITPELINPDSVIKYDFHEITLVNIKDNPTVKVRKKVNETIHMLSADWTYDQEKLDKLWKENIKNLTLKNSSEHFSKPYLKVDGNTGNLYNNNIKDPYKEFVKAVIVRDKAGSIETVRIGAVYRTQKRINSTETIDDDEKYELWTPYDNETIYRRKLVYTKDSTYYVEYNKELPKDLQYSYGRDGFIKSNPFNDYALNENYHLYFDEDAGIIYEGKGFLQ